uniref:Ctr_85_TN conopeptide n=1 Tax=Conus tribblei TaxID=101761 RepID=A0A0C9SEQ1_CONTD
MAMNLSMTISVLVVVVMATTVVGSTPLQDQGLSRNERNIHECCTRETHQCTTQCWDSNDEDTFYCLPNCYHIYATEYCGSDNRSGCCLGFLDCYLNCAVENRTDLPFCYNSCKDVSC